MRKIYKLKEWYSLDDAASRLSLTLGEDISKEDIIQLALEGHIKLSWYMRHVTADSVEYGTKTLSLMDIETRKEVPVTATRFFSKGSDHVVVLDGPHHLLLEHCGALTDYLMSEITQTGGDLSSLDGFYVQDSEGTIWNIMERYDINVRTYATGDKKSSIYDIADYYPSGRWPDISELGFVKKDIEEFEAYFQSDLQEKPISERERQTLYKMIIGMATDGYGFDPNALRSPFPKELEGILDHLGIAVSDDTIREKLREAAGLLPHQSD